MNKDIKNKLYKKIQFNKQQSIVSVIICNDDNFDGDIEFDKEFETGDKIEDIQQMASNRIVNKKKSIKKNKINNNIYDNLQRIGQGTYSQVYKATNKITNQDVAIKIVKLNPQEGISFTTIREGSLLKCLKHANIIHLNNIIMSKNSFWFEFEYMKTDLHKYIKSRTDYISNENIKLIMFQILRGLEYCHDKNILHRDLKPQNILLNSNGEVKIADFGLARSKSMSVNRNYSNEVVTVWYRSPDLLLGSRNYDCKIDIWSAGCIFAEMIQNRILFSKNNVSFNRDSILNENEEQFKIILIILGCLDEKFIEKYIPNDVALQLSKSFTRNQLKANNLNYYIPRINDIEYAYDLLSNLLKYLPDDRLTAHDALRHEYFIDLPQSIYSIHKDDSIFKIKDIEFLTDI